MSANVSKMLEREGKLGSMEERAEALQAGTQLFQVVQKWFLNESFSRLTRIK